MTESGKQNTITSDLWQDSEDFKSALISYDTESRYYIIVISPTICHKSMVLCLQSASGTVQLNAPPELSILMT